MFDCNGRPPFGLDVGANHVGGGDGGMVRIQGDERLCHAIVNALLPHDVHIAPFLWCDAVTKRKPPAVRNIGIDLHRRMIDKF